jgi:hypothetical protein
MLAPAEQRAGETARAELEMVLIRAQLERFERRFNYWSERTRELSRAGGH